MVEHENQDDENHFVAASVKIADLNAKVQILKDKILAITSEQ